MLCIFCFLFFVLFLFFFRNFGPIWFVWIIIEFSYFAMLLELCTFNCRGLQDFVNNRKVFFFLFVCFLFVFFNYFRSIESDTRKIREAIHIRKDPNPKINTSQGFELSPIYNSLLGSENKNTTSVNNSRNTGSQLLTTSTHWWRDQQLLVLKLSGI